jgi:AcrR family transcriptional regulator
MTAKTFKITNVHLIVWAMARRAGSSGAETAEKLRNVALELFAQSGYAAVSMRAIAAATGVQAGAIYNHFPTKQDLLNELLQVHMETLLASWAEAEQHGLLPPDALEEFVRFHIRYHLDRSREVFISYMELRNLEGENFNEIERLRRQYERVPYAILECGHEDGRARPARDHRAEEEYGGAGMGYLAHAPWSMEEISRASASVGLSYGAIPISASTRSAERHRGAEGATCRS